MDYEYDIIMYKKVFLMHKLTASERLVYSYLIGQAVLKEVGFTVLSWADSHAKIKIDDLENEPWRELEHISDRTISKHCGISTKSAYNARMGLISKGIIRGKKVYAPCEIVFNGYITLATATNLTGELLLFYSWYKKYCESHDNKDYTSSEKLALFYKTTPITMRLYIHRLEQKGFIKRTRTEQRPYGYISFVPK